MLLAAENELIRRWAPEDEYWRGAVESIAGLTMTDDLTLEITMEYCDETVKNLLTDIYIVSLQYYGDRDLFRTEQNLFGFTRGDLSSVRAHVGDAFGAGEYVYRETEIRTVMLQADDNLRFGKKTIVFVDEIHRFNKAQQDRKSVV